MTDAHMPLAHGHEHDHAHDDHDHSHLTPEQELDNAKFATWLYIGSEVMIFSGMLVAYLIFRRFNYTAVELAKDHLSIQLVSLNTFLLLASSWMMVMGLREVQRGNNKGLVRWLTGTVVFGAIFVGLQVVEYVELAHNGIVLTVPTEAEVAEIVESGDIPHWLEEGIAALEAEELANASIAVETGDAAIEGEELLSEVGVSEEATLTEQATIVAQDLGKFGQRFYAPTAFHGAHVIVGCLWGLWIINRAQRRKFTAQRYASVEVFGLYWHFVDVVWIVLFTFIYLI